ncbi:phosphoglucosamine mutase, partial [Halorubrum pallidum]
CTLAALVGSEGSLAAAVDDLPTYPIRRDSVRTESKRAVVDRVAEIARDEFADISTLDGIRVETDAGWFLVRASGTEPLVRLTAEARDETDADALFETTRDLVARAAEKTR